MNLFILATEALADPPGDDLATLSYILLGITLVVAAVATLMVTPKADDHTSH